MLDVLRDAERGRIRWPSDQQRVSQSDTSGKRSTKKPARAATEKLRFNQLPPEERQVTTLEVHAGLACPTRLICLCQLGVWRFRASEGSAAVDLYAAVFVNVEVL